MHLGPSQAARRLGVSAKALRLYEQHGLIAPHRTRAGWRSYGPAEMARAARIVEMRALGLALREIAHALAGDPRTLEQALAAHEAVLHERARDLGEAVHRLRRMRAGLAPPADASHPARRPAGTIVAFDLPWPWGGERFAVREVAPLTHIVGPLGSGKTRLALRLAEVLPGAAFVGLDRLANDGAAARASLDADRTLRRHVETSLAALKHAGATASAALIALLSALHAQGPAILVIDMLEQDLDTATQEALIAHLRRRGTDARPLFFLTRSSAILDLDAVGAGEAIILCPANHSPPSYVVPRRGSPGYEAVATCLAAPSVRARTAGVIAVRPAAGA
jgi:DNA-binding transcriptional MerR regulator